jgi:hypothetical protein
MQISGVKSIFDRFRRAVTEDAARLHSQGEGEPHNHGRRRDPLLENLVALVPDALDALEWCLAGMLVEVEAHGGLFFSSSPLMMTGKSLC